MSAPKTKIRVGINSSPPATPQECAGRANTKTDRHTSNDLRARVSGDQRRQSRRQEALRNQQHPDCHQQDGYRPLKPMIGDMRE
jgi:hypothetical protein